LGTIRPSTADITDQYITADTPEVVIGHGMVTSQETSTSLPPTVSTTQTPPVHTYRSEVALAMRHRQ